MLALKQEFFSSYTAVTLNEDTSPTHSFRNINWGMGQIYFADSGNYQPLEVKTIYYKNSPIRVVITPDGLEWVALDILRALFSSDRLCNYYWALQTLPIIFRPKRLIKSSGVIQSQENMSNALLKIKHTLRVDEIHCSKMQNEASFRTVILHEVLFSWLSKYLSNESIYEFCDWFSNHTQLVDMGCERQYQPEVIAYFAA